MMNTGERIQKLGFKRWYERTLIEGHAYLISALLGMILAFAGLEAIGEDQGVRSLLFGLSATAFGALILAFGIRRYFGFLLLAQSFGERATCGRCHAYAAFNIVASGMPNGHEPESPTSLWLKVQCRRCGNEWRI